MIVALFPGQNSHAVGMGTAMRDAYGVSKAVFETADQALPGITNVMAEGPLEDLTLTANQQPALVTASIAAYRAWQEATGLKPAYAVGHSLGEFSAHVAAGTLDLFDAIQLVHKRGTYMQEAVPVGLGAMAAVMGEDIATITQVCKDTPGVVEVANFNAPTQTVISGEANAVQAASAELKSKGFKVIPLKVSAPFHCSLMQSAREKLEHDLQAIQYGEMQFPVIANYTAQEVQTPEEVAALLSAQVTGSVRFVESIFKLRDLGVTEFVEFGSGTVLTGLLKRILPEAKSFNIHTPEDIQKYLEAHQ
ncbi:ACP S-malonyltransferase [Deinococcus cellulosilyticus]|uniref:Malonyl CoA-acyl carrier protein transacylase n=1 Tax=Deinococcus cellulosilyticus (strain DSM 18568 / NBRC 106333 / KACC 11606 / 5516J-15) TaxID=1223518 RepID=A0A511N107_DEIC1|nr:ACP S-malonyltransferase [Deinococcus cellulosilyticus]GEM46552.1 malonyl CoA-acyl carrier protein transacylase [Deinococcus cellulosilyticus NBRC 106333 = KACC 11606]